MAFKQQVIADLESGRFSSIEAVMLYNWRRPHQALRYAFPMSVHTAA